MDWTYAGQMALSLILFAPGIVFLALYLLVGPFTWKRKPAPEAEKLPKLERAPPRPLRSTVHRP